MSSYILSTRTLREPRLRGAQTGIPTRSPLKLVQRDNHMTPVRHDIENATLIVIRPLNAESFDLVREDWVYPLILSKMSRVRFQLSKSS